MKKLFLFALCSALVAPLSAAPFEGAFLGISGGGTILEGRTPDLTTAEGISPRVGVRGGILGLHAGMDGVFSGGWLVGVGANIDFAEEALIARGVAGELKLGHVVGNVAMGIQAGWGTVKISEKAYTARGAGHIHRGGPTLGAFMSTMLTDHLELTGQYNHTFYGKDKGLSLDQDTLRLKVAYKF